MAKEVLTAAIISILAGTLTLTGCRTADTGSSQLVPSPGGVTMAVAAEADESDIVERTAADRMAYRKDLETLMKYYKSKGNNMKLLWAESELKQLDSIKRYNYIIEASVAGPQLKATASIAEADYLYDQATRLEDEAGRLVVIKNENLLRQALQKYNQIIAKHPTSDKIDDAAFRAAGIYEYFKDYTIALLYYQRTYQWDPQTSYPAMFKAAYILDKELYRRAEALELYKQFLEKKIGSAAQREYAVDRVSKLSSSGNGPQK